MQIYGYKLRFRAINGNKHQQHISNNSHGNERQISSHYLRSWWFVTAHNLAVTKSVGTMMIMLYTPIGSMYAIYGNIYHQYTPNVSIYIYIPYMDPMGTGNPIPIPTSVGIEEVTSFRRGQKRQNTSIWTFHKDGGNLRGKHLPVMSVSLPNPI